MPLLQKAAKAITKGCRTDDIIARLGGRRIHHYPAEDRGSGSGESDKAHQENHRGGKSTRYRGLHCLRPTVRRKWKRLICRNSLRSLEDDMYRQKLYESSSMRSKTVDLIMSTLYEKNNRESSHSKRVSEISEAIAKKMDFDSEQVNQIRITGLMHDIGKIGINEKILNKVGKLDEGRV